MVVITRLILISSLLFMSIRSDAQKEIFVDQIKFLLETVSDIEYENEYFMTMKFSSGIKYKFYITNHVDNFEGEAILEILDADKLVLTNLHQNQPFKQFQFNCNKTGFYDLLIRYKDNKVGNSIIDIKMLQ